MTTFTYHHSSLLTFGFENYKIRIYLHVLHVPSLLISPPFRLIWGSHRYVGMFFPILIQTSSVIAVWILLPVIITPLCLARIESLAPLKTNTIVSRPSVPWYNDDIHKAKLLRRKAERKWKKTKRETNFQLCKKRRNHVTHLLNEAKRTFFTDFVEDNSSDQGRLFRATRTLLGKNDSTLSFLDYDDKSLLVNDIARFFARKIMRIRDQIDPTVIADMNTVPDDPIVSDAKILSEFKPLSEADILALIQKSSKKTCNLDPMPTKLVVESLDHLLPVITKMINSSLLGGHFPKVLKEALIDPRYKKAGINDFTNLRPVSNLQYVSKLVERAVFDQVHAHLSEHDLYPLLQSAYTRGHSKQINSLNQDI